LLALKLLPHGFLRNLNRSAASGIEAIETLLNQHARHVAHGATVSLRHRSKTLQ